jgi:capsular exopolysaccharide synthesis family protein
MTINESIAKKQEEIAAMTQRFTEEHPRLIKARGELKALQEALSAAAIDATNRVLPLYQEQVAQEKEMEQAVLKRSKEAIQYDALQREVESNRELYKTLLSRIKETEITKSMDDDSMRIVESAVASSAPVKPDSRKVILASIAGGLFLGLVLAFGLHMIDQTVKSPDQIEATVGLPALTVISEARRGRKSKSRSRGFQTDITAAVRESFRSLVVSLKLLGRKQDSRIFLFTSAIPAEGKTFCSYHCAVQLAAQGVRTLLIDADLRKPFLHEMVKDSSLVPGLSEVLSDQAKASEVIMATSVENLFFLSGGTHSPNPPKLLAGPALADMLNELRDLFDCIILDSAPINAVADSLLIAQHVQQVCMIARAGVTPTRALNRAIQSLSETAGKQPCGVILNRYRRRRGLYYYYNYSYHKSYGEYGAYGSGKKGSDEAVDVAEDSGSEEPPDNNILQH